MKNFMLLIGLFCTHVHATLSEQCSEPITLNTLEAVMENSAMKPASLPHLNIWVAQYSQPKHPQETPEELPPPIEVPDPQGPEAIPSMPEEQPIEIPEEQPVEVPDDL